MHLVRDPLEAEDVLQATFLAAIEGAQSFDDSRRLMPWLTGILARQAGLARRSARRVIEHDRLNERVQADPAELAALKEFSEELVDALQALPENHREVLWLHLADGRRPVDIARELQRAPGTVRMQVHRGLELLRRALPAGFSAAGSGVLGATRGLSAIRSDLLASAAARFEPSPISSAGPSSAGAGTLGGTVAIAKISLTVLAVLGLVAAVWWRWNSEVRDSASLANADVGVKSRAATDSLTRPPDKLAARRALATDAPNFAAVPSTSTNSIFLRGHVSGVRPEEQRDVKLTVRGLARFALPADLAVHGNPTLDGDFALDVTQLFAAARPKRPIEELVVEADHPRYGREELRIPAEALPATTREYSAQIELTPAALVTGRVLMQDKQLDVGTVVLLFALIDGAPLAPPLDRVTCSADGRFFLRAREAGEHVLVAVRNNQRPTSVRASLAPGSSCELGTIIVGEGATIDGQAYHMGVPMPAGGLISASTTSSGAWYAFEGSRFFWNGNAFERGGAIVETDADGRFRIGGIAPGTYRLGVSRAAWKGAPASQSRLLLSTAGWTQIDAPATGVKISSSFATFHLQLRTNATGAEIQGKRALVHWQQGASKAEFALELDGLGSISVEPDAECRVRVEAEGFLTSDLTLDAPHGGEETTQVVLLQMDPKLARLSIAVHASPAAAAESITEASFEFTTNDTRGFPTSAFVRHATSDDGVFQVADLPAGTWSVSVLAGGAYRHYRDFWCEAKSVVRLSPGNSQAIEVVLERGGRLSISARDSAGVRLAADCRLSTLGDELLDVELVGRAPERVAKDKVRLSTLSDSEVHPILHPGRYAASLHAEGFEPERVVIQVEPGAVARVQAVLLKQGLRR